MPGRNAVPWSASQHGIASLAEHADVPEVFANASLDGNSPPDEVIVMGHHRKCQMGAH